MVSPGQAYWLARRRKTKAAQQVAQADLEDAAADVNALGKFVGKLVFNLDDYQTYEALGPDATDAWRPVGVFDNSKDVTPVEG